MSRARRWLLALGLAAFAWFAVVRLVGAVDWSAVGDAFDRLSWWASVPLLVGLVLRQTLNGIPLWRYVPGLTLGRSVQNDLAANVVASLAPPPADVVLRIAQFRSWGVDPADGLAGVALNTVTFYAVRFGVPVLGAGLLLVGAGIDGHQWLLVGVGAVVSVACLVALALLLRSNALAAWLGRAAARVAGRFRAGIDDEAWSQYVVALRERTSGRLRSGLALSLVGLVAMVTVDCGILLIALRAVGLPVSALGALDVLGAFLVVYPLTLLPAFGLGVLDAALVGALTVVAGSQWEATLVAGTIVWRVVTILGTLVLGGLVVARWRHVTR